MKKIMMAGLVALALASCNGVRGTVQTRVIADPQINDGSIEVIKTVTPAVPGTDTTPGTPERVSWSTANEQPVEISFVNRPTSDAVYFTSYSIVRDIAYVGGRAIDQTSTDPVANTIYIYVPSGWTCPEASQVRSCGFTDSQGNARTDVVPANGIKSNSLLINLTTGLVSDVIATNAGASRTVDLRFDGQTATGQPISVPVTGVRAIAVKTGGE